MFARTDIKQARWYVVKADVKKCARLNCITHLLNLIPYQDLTPTPPKLPPRPNDGAYLRPPLENQTFILEVW
ncbi:Polyphosphate kinase 2 (PPK2) [Bythopirellula goksoeyrii]|uniref:Polyphosphate kinase 2 (PPK2) n=2 Tax=Bythopirellula goksoeyrii TaxID=1400387 RepID=A0A5B9Q975_9BACT|nr:Polyphosphate kinase 2 (PPK2) [Bythopirellula goksoeyrii]